MQSNHRVPGPDYKQQDPFGANGSNCAQRTHYQATKQKAQGLCGELEGSAQEKKICVYRLKKVNKCLLIYVL